MRGARGIRPQIAQRRCPRVPRKGAHHRKFVHGDFSAPEKLSQGEACTRSCRRDREKQLRIRRGQSRRESAVTKPTEEILLQDDKQIDARKIACHLREIIKLIGEDASREGLRKTPERFETALKFLTSGYHQNLDHVLNGATFSVAYDEMVVVKDIEIFSLCEHHVLPFFGKAHVAYLPDKRVLGLSQVARAIEEKLAPQGVGVIIEARHLCMQMRGVEKQHGSAVTSAMLGAFRHNKQTRDEFLALVRRKNS